MTRIARIAAGLVLIGGALLLATNAIHHARDTHEWRAWQIIVGTWAAAFGVAGIGSFVRDRGDRHRVAGFVIPSVGAALMMPLTLHLIAFGMFGWMPRFDSWVLFSLAFVGVAHIVFAIMVGMRAAAIAEGRIPIRVGTIYLTTVCCGGIPGIVVVLPVILVAITGLFIVPMLHWMERWWTPLQAELPTAVARAA